jgi:hypothetical protein
LSWAQTEFEGIDLGDGRRNRRAIRLVEKFGAQPGASIPQSCEDWADTMAAYRFFGNEEVQWTDILAPHLRNTAKRMEQHKVVLCIQDTTELDFNGQETQDLGPLSYEAQGGMYLHPTYAISTQREPLGVLDAWMWARELRQSDGTRAGVLESQRWIEGYERLAELAAQLPNTRLVYLADREADIVALMARARDLGTPLDWLIRAKHNRSLDAGLKLWQSVAANEPIGELRFVLPARQAQRAREVVQQVWVQALDIADGQGGSVRVSCFIARETEPAPGDQPIEWRLLSNLPIETLDEAAKMIDWYRARWEIEMYFHVLKMS